MNYNNYTKAELIQILKEKEKDIKPGNCPYKIYENIRKYGLKDKEHFLVTMLDGSHNIIKTELITMGLVNRTLVHPREVFRPAIKNNATAVVLSHNHPSGNLEPSQDDLECTIRLRKAGQLIGIEVLDHLIFSSSGYHSMMESGELI